MKKFNDIVESLVLLNEKLITLGGKAYPPFGNVVIMAGGAGSGKGFIKSNLIGLEGANFDVDELKKLAIKSDKIEQKVKEEMGIDFTELRKPNSLKKPENVALLHDIIKTLLNLDDKKKETMFTSILIAAPDRKPNIIFDTTLASISKLANLTRSLAKIGYDSKNIHIVWVVNDIEVAKIQNLKRSRTVPTEILVNTHRGVSQTMNDILSMGKDLSKYMDGDIVFAFNKVNVDATLAKSAAGGHYIKDAAFFYVKKSGHLVTSPDKLSDTIKQKIKAYVPKEVQW